MILLLLIFIVFAFGTLIYLLIKFSTNKTRILIAMVIVGIVIFSGYFYRQEYYFAKSINLENESISGLKIGETITNAKELELEKVLGEMAINTGMVVTIYSDHDQTLTFHQWYLGMMDGKISMIVTESEDAETEKGIKIGDPVKKVIEKYGEHYFSISEDVGNTIGYIDRHNKIVLQLVIYDEKVYQIVLKSK